MQQWVAAKGLIRDFGEVEHLQVSQKGPKDFVTAADLRSEKVIKEELLKVYPKASFLMEESGHSNGDNDLCFIVDPLDGTHNFMHGFPQFAINIALKKEGEIFAAITYDPCRDEMFWAQKGMGTYVTELRRDRRLRVAGRRSMDQALIVMGLHLKAIDAKIPYRDLRNKIEDSTLGIRKTGSSALNLAYVAAGRFDGAWLEGQSPWDIAPGILLIREAGGDVTDRFGNKDDMITKGSVVAGNDFVQKELQKMISA